MITENAALMKSARESLKEKWGLAIGTFFVYNLIIVLTQIIPYIGTIASLIIIGPLVLRSFNFFFVYFKKPKSRTRTDISRL